METKENWNQDEYHPSKQCFFCRKRPAFAYDNAELYKVIRNAMGGPGYVVNYAKALIPIPVCSQCAAVHRAQGKVLRLLMFVGWIITSLIIFWIAYTPADGFITSMIFSMVIAIPFSYVPIYALVIVWGLCRDKTDEAAGQIQYPVVKKLLSMGWQSDIPKTKYGKRMNQDIDEDTIQRINIQYQREAERVNTEFLLWCGAEENARKSKGEAK